MDLAYRGAQNLAKNHLALQGGERVVLLHIHADEVLPTIVAALEETGARVEVVALSPWSAIVDDREYARLVTERVRSVQASMYVSCGEGTYPRARLLVDTLNQTEVRHLHVPNISLRMLGTSLRADPVLIERINERVAERLDRGRTLRVTSPAGTDLSVTISRGYPLVHYRGIPAPGAWDSAPTGAVSFYSPGVSGTYVVDRIARGSELERPASDLYRAPIVLRFSSSALRSFECEDPVLSADLEALLAKDPRARHVGFVSFSTNYLTRNTLEVFANDALLPGLRLMIGYSDQTKTKAPHTSATWATFHGRQQTVEMEDRALVRSGRLDPDLTSGIVPF